MFAASLRSGSLNHRLALLAARAITDRGGVVDLAHQSEFDAPSYDEDVQASVGFPEAAERFRARLRSSDAFVIASPEYNGSLPGVLKNAIDWVSRPPDQPFAEKPIGIMGASTSLLGTGRMQYHLRQACVFLDAHPLNKPEVFVTRAAEKFDENLRLIDEPTRALVKKHLEALMIWVERLRVKP